MKNFFLLSIGALMIFSIQVNAQVGINTSTPTSTLDITAKNATGTTTEVDGILIPRVSRQRALNMASIPVSTMIYVNSLPAGTQTGIAINIDAVGFYYYDGSLWSKMNTSVNIYNSNGTLTTNRVVTTAGNQLSFNNGTNSSVRITTSNIEGRVTTAGTSRGSLGLSSGTSTLDIIQDNNSTAQITTNGTSAGMSIATLNATPINISTNNITRATVTSAGNVGIGTGTPAQTLHVAGNVRIEGTTGTPTTIAGRNGAGDIGNVAVGTGLALSGGTLSANAVPISNIVFPFLNIQPSGSGVYTLDSVSLPNYTLWVSSALPSAQCSINLPNPNTMVGRTITIIAAGGDTRVCVPTGQGLPAGNGDNAAFRIIPDFRRATFQASDNFGGMWTVIAKDF